MKLFDPNVARKVADYLLKIKAIKLQPQSHFTWASGWKSPIYCDNRLVLSFPEARTFVRQQLVEAVRQKFPQPDVIAGVATGAIAQGALVAQEMDLPFVYVRSKAKEHGRGNQVEGHLEKGQKVVVIEDLISTGMSSLNAVDALREEGADVLGMVAIFTYGFQKAVDNFAQANCEAYTLSDYENMLPAAVESGYINESQVDLLKHWRTDPGNWSGE